ncbi:MAG: helix-turn-helix transcriptional regulator [Chloroflexi bacterium]|nr:helix-turn-helix transcriptional regulator [Chloroflexota bacterium]
MTQRDLAAELGVPSNTLARWERGELEVQHPRMLRLALQGIVAQASAQA